MADQARFDHPVVIDPDHDLLSFQCGEPILDDWLKTRALKNLALGASRTFVTCHAGSNRVVGYYALSMGSLFAIDTPGSIRRNMPEIIPSVVLGRLAIDETAQGHGLGAALLHDAVNRSLVASQNVSARLVVVHAISQRAEQFYLRFGFVRMPVEDRTLALDLVKYQKR
ncbi:GNAT family N-acetyltransferase [Rhizobium sp. TH2]|uniref:GNAT family N-acetyltransferase n=1 Tax=Rhizobium sp. TH2 TaxID=2775403 RepID=UPI002157BE0C|nr:GNAT family N-acetyltransferase [Rhizobium sp. TH2]UVC07625.1 GNAT family N-acetyltransferase [Rhizobium sp. TH2]